MSEFEEPDVSEVEDFEDTEDTQDDPPQKEWTDDDEAEARAFGWKSPDEWQGRVPDGFIDDPRKYVERAMTFRPFRTLKERLDNVDQEYSERLRKLEVLNDRALQTQRQQFEARLEGIRQRKVQAVDMADKDQYAQLDREEHLTRQAMQQAFSQPQQPQQPQPDPWVAEYASTEQGKWLQDQSMRAAGYSLIEANPHVKALPAQEQVRWAEARLKQDFPERFGVSDKPAPRRTVDGGGLAGGGRSDAFSKLPREAKETFQRYVKEGVIEDTKETRKEWADEYNAA